MNDGDRVTELEIKISYLEKSYGDLSEVVHHLHNKIDLLLQLTGRVQSLESKVEPAAPADDKPPHY